MVVVSASPTAAVSINREAVKLILSLRSPQQRILFPNTNSGYGIGEKGDFCTEESPLRPISLYGKTKVEAEMAVLEAGNALRTIVNEILDFSTMEAGEVKLDPVSFSLPETLENCLSIVRPAATVT